MAKTARAKVDVLIAERLSWIYRNRCPGFSEIAVRDLMESLSANYRNPHGIALHQGVGKFKADLPRVLENLSNDLSPSMRQLLASLFEDIRYLEGRIANANRQIEAIANANDTARRLMTVPGIGALTATGLMAAAGTGRQFRKARDMAAWLGLVRREYSTGARQPCSASARGAARTCADC